MEFNNPSQIVKDLNFGNKAKDRIINGVDKLTNAVKSTLGASGKCVIYEDAMGQPVITKDGVTVAESVVLLDPVENMGATLIKEAASNTVKEAGDGTTTAIVLAESLLKTVNDPKYKDESIRNIKNGIESACKKVMEYLSKYSTPVSGTMLESIAKISCNNDERLGRIISDAYKGVGKDGVVLLEDSESHETEVEIVDGVQIQCKLKSNYLMTDKERGVCDLDNPCVLIVASPITSIRKIQNILEYVIKNKRSLLIIGDVEQQPLAALMANKVKGNIKVNIIDLPGFGPTRDDTVEDVAILTGAKVINEVLGDDLDLIETDVLGEVIRSVTDDKNTVLQIYELKEVIDERLKIVKKLIKNEKNGFLKKKHEERLAMLSGSVGIVKVGADSKVELKEKRDRVEDAIHATKAALKEGIIPGGGIALLNAASKITPANLGEEILLKAIKAPYNIILENAGLKHDPDKEMVTGVGVNVITGNTVKMIDAGIIDPVLVTKSALKNAVSVVSTIISADCVISNIRIDNASS